MRKRLQKRSEVMNPPASAAQGAEARNLNMEQRHGTGAVPRAAEARPADAVPPPRRMSIDEIAHILDREEDIAIEILPNGEVRQKGDAEKLGIKPLTMR